MVSKRRLLIAFAAVVGGSTMLAGPAYADRAVVITPDTGLVELQTVTVSGAGYGDTVSVAMCQAVPVEPASAANCGGSILIATTSGGTFSVDYTVRRFMYVPVLARTVDCADPSENCGIGVAEINDIEGTAIGTPISFAPAPPPPSTRGAITVTPDTTNSGAIVLVEGSGFRANAAIEILQCRPAPTNPTDCAFGIETVTADAAGTFSAGFTAVPEFSSQSSIVECRGAANLCVIAAGETVDIPGTIVTTPITISDPIASVAPDTDLAPDQSVTVTGTNFVPPGRSLVLQQCVAFSSNCLLGEAVTSDAAGAFTEAFTVRRLVNGTDCAAFSGRCDILVTDADTSAILWRTPISFAPLPPPPPGDIVVAPDPPFSDGDTVLVTGDNWLPGARVIVAQCASSHPEAPLLDPACQGRVVLRTNATGHFSTNVTVLAHYNAVDCAIAPCEIRVQRLSWWLRRWLIVRVPITFD